MTYHPDNMEKVADWGEALPEDWYHVRISKIKEADSKESHEPTVYMSLVCQEEPQVGRVIPDNCSLQSHALAKLKRYYICAGKGIKPEGGHDPELLNDCEVWVKVIHTTNKGEMKMSIPPYGIRSLQEGRPLS